MRKEKKRGRMRRRKDYRRLSKQGQYSVSLSIKSDSYPRTHRLSCDKASTSKAGSPRFDPLFPRSCHLILSYLILSYLSRSLIDRWGTTVDFTTSFLHSSRLSTFRCGIFHSRPVHSLMLSSHRFLCLPLRLPP